MKIHRDIDAFSPRIFEVLTANQRLFDVTVTAVKHIGATSDPLEFIRYDFYNAALSMLSHDLTLGMPFETLSWEYQAATVSVTPQDAYDKPLQSRMASWDFVRDTADISGSFEVPSAKNP